MGKVARFLFGFCFLFTFESQGFERNFRISTFNVYDLKLISKLRKVRMPAIGTAVKSRNLDVAVFQEAWTAKSRWWIQYNSEFPYGEYFDGPYFGSGLYTLSRHPILSKDFRPFELNGRLWRVWEGDRLAAKGISRVTIDYFGSPIDIFNTHTIARYSDFQDPSDYFSPERMSQIFEVFDFIIRNRTSENFVLGGDLNSNLSSDEIQFLKTLMGLEITSLKGQCTYCPPNTLVTGPNNGQLDYIITSPKLKLMGYGRDFEELIEVKGGVSNLSDHYGITATLNLNSEKTYYNTKRTFQAVAYLREKLSNYLEISSMGQEDKGLVDKLKVRKHILKLIDLANLYFSALNPMNPFSINVLNPMIENREIKVIQENCAKYAGLFSVAK